MSCDTRRAVLRGIAGATAGALATACAPSPAGAGPSLRPQAGGVSTGPTAQASPSSERPDSAPFLVTSGPRSRPCVALTFHGQGSPALTDALLSLLEASGARATVLAVGVWLQEQPHLAQRILGGGHELGNHTMHHGDISTMPAERAFAEIADCAAVLHRLTGSPGRWFRPSQARDCTAALAAQVRQAGYAHCLGYDLDSLDFTDPGPSAVTSTVLNGARPGSVVSLHLGHPGTVTAMPAILDGLRARALQPVTMSELID